MSKIFKRPMFRKGGQVMDGVMSLAAPRSNYQKGGIGISPELAEKYPELASEYQKSYDFYRDVAQQDMGQAKSDILSNLLIRGGLGLVSGEGAGKGTLGGLATAFRGPTEQAMGELQKLKGTEQQIKSAALGSAMEAESARKKSEAEMALLERKLREGKLYEAQTAESQIKSILSLYEDIPGMDVGAATTLSRKDVRAATIIPDDYGGMIPMSREDKTQIDTAWVRTQPDNTVLLNPYDRLYYKKKGNQLILLDQKTLEEPKGE